MGTVNVLYVGKKPELLLEMSYLSKKYPVRSGTVTVMDEKDAEKLIDENPVPFSVVAPGNKDYPITQGAEKIRDESIEAMRQKEIEKAWAESTPKKYVSQMNHGELLAYAKEKFQVDLDPEKTKAALRVEIAKIEKAQTRKA